MKIQIIGAGAIGCFVASMLAQNQGVTVTLVGRDRFVEAIERAGGLRVSGFGDTSTVSGVEAVVKPVSDADINLIAVKSYDTDQVATQLLAAGAVDTPVVSLQNGVGNEEALRESGFTSVYAVSLTAPVSVLGPGNIRIDKPTRALGLAAWPNADGPSGDARPLADIFSSGGFETTVFSSAASLKWTKLLMNVAGNATSAVLDRTADKVFEDPRLVDLEIRVWREALEVMRASGIKPIRLGSYPFNILAPLIERVPMPLLRPTMRKKVVAGRGTKMPSLHIDAYGKSGATEVAWLNGAVAVRGSGVGVATPLNTVLAEAVEAVAANGVPWDAKRLLTAADLG